MSKAHRACESDIEDFTKIQTACQGQILKVLIYGLDTICGDESELTDIIQNMTDEVDIEILDVFGDFAARHESM